MLASLRGPVETATGRESRWTGVVEADETLTNALAAFRPDGSIAALPELTRRKTRWRTLIHELTHSVAAPMETGQYERRKGWEEGPVEIVQRHIRAAVMDEVGEPYDEQHTRATETFWPFQPYVEAIEAIAAATGEDPFRLSLELLSVPISQRPALLIRRHPGRAVALAKHFGTLNNNLHGGTITAEQDRLSREED